ATPLTRTYNNNLIVNLTAPAAAGGNNFQKWLKDGADFANNTFTNVTVNMDVDHTMTAVYVTPPSLFVEQGNSTQLAAMDSVTFVPGPFTLNDDHNFSSDHRTRIVFFATDLAFPAPAQPDINTLAVVINGTSYAVESVGPNATVSGSYIVFRLPDLPPGTYPLSIKVRGVMSANSPTITIN